MTNLIFGIARERLLASMFDNLNGLILIVKSRDRKNALFSESCAEHTTRKTRVRARAASFGSLSRRLLSADFSARDAEFAETFAADHWGRSRGLKAIGDQDLRTDTEATDETSVIEAPGVRVQQVVKRNRAAAT